MTDRTRSKITMWFWLIFSSLILLALLLPVSTYFFGNIPSFTDLENNTSKLATLVLDENGTVLATFHEENRTFVGYEELSPNLVSAAIATEDRRFYDHSGIDVKSLIRVFVKTLLLRDSSQGGGSTITQQLAKTLYPREDISSLPLISRVTHMVGIKMKEWVTAVKLERSYTKEELMTMYMNAIFFGGNSYGIKAASNTFFSKDPVDLNVQEAATLVGMVNKPTRYNPVLNPEQSLARRNHVISKMCDAGFIDRHQRDSISALPIELNYMLHDHNSGHAPYFRDMLRRIMNAKCPERSRYSQIEDYRRDSLLWAQDDLYGWLNKNTKADGSPYNLDRDGLRIHTTLNAKMQQFAEEAVAEHLGNYLQNAFKNEQRYNSNRPFASDVPKETVETLMKQARRWSDRYRMMKESGRSESEILRSFDEKTKMRVFAWNAKGYTDTTMTPNDSIRYYKSLLRASFMAIEPVSGHVKAYVGGPNYRYFKYDNVRQGRRQVGSTVKPFLYTLAMEQGLSPCHRVVNVPQTFDVVGQDETWTPKSTDKAEWIGKNVTLRWGLMHSSNNISAYLMKQFGPEAMAQMMRRMGISSYIDAVYPLCVGSCDLSLYEMVAAYNTFPSAGVYTRPIFVTSIEDNAGNPISAFTTTSHEAISEESAYLMEMLMAGVINGGTGSRLRSVYRLTGDIGGKTGTNNDQADGWFIGYTPKITAGVWVGAEDRQVHFSSLALGGGSNMALPIWGIFMTKCVNDGTVGIGTSDSFVSPAGFDMAIDCGTDMLDAESGPVEGSDSEDYFD